MSLMHNAKDNYIFGWCTNNEFDVKEVNVQNTIEIVIWLMYNTYILLLIHKPQIIFVAHFQINKKYVKNITFTLTKIKFMNDVIHYRNWV